MKIWIKLILFIFLLIFFRVSIAQLNEVSKGDIYFGGVIKSVPTIPYWNTYYFDRFPPPDIGVANLFGLGVDFKRKGFIHTDFGFGYNRDSLGIANSIEIGAENYRIKNLLKNLWFFRYGVSLNYQRYRMNFIDNIYNSKSDAFILRPSLGLALKEPKNNIIVSLVTFSEFSYSVYSNKYNGNVLTPFGRISTLLYKYPNFKFSLTFRIKKKNE